MNADSDIPIGEVTKAKTGIKGFDQITRGGLPAGGVTLVSGGSGSGKTIFALQTLVNGATLCNESGLFIGFEESSRKILANAASFGWPLEELRDQKLFFLDAMPAADSVTIGEFDLSGMLAILMAKVKASGIKRIAFDSLDVLLHLLPSVSLQRREMHRLHSWLLEHQLTTIVTAKTDWLGNSVPIEDGVLQYLPFMVDCVVSLTHVVENEFSRRRLRIIKYRGSSFSENEIPFTINRHGLDVATADSSVLTLPASTERVSTGVIQLDQMLFGGIVRGSTTMITGSPGTAKTSLAGAFAEAAAFRGERLVYVAFDEPGEEIVRNLSSVNIHLQKQVDAGMLRIYNEYVGSRSAEEHFQRIRMLVQNERAVCLVIDPFTAFSTAGDLGSTQAVAARLVRWVKSQGITMVCTSLPIANQSAFPGTLLNITSVADTWIYLNFFDGGERNRGLTIIKSRGTNHSNQVRELILASSGISLAAPYTAEGTVLMGTMRWQKELAEAETRARLSAEFERKSAAIDEELADLDGQMQVLQRNIAAKRMAQGSMVNAEQRRQAADQDRYSEMVELRKAGELDSGGDLSEPAEKPADEGSHP